MQFDFEKRRRVKRVHGLVVELEKTSEETEVLMNELISMKKVFPALMTAEALRRYMEAPEYLVNVMHALKLEESFEYEGILITRHSQHLYNGKNMNA